MSASVKIHIDDVRIKEIKELVPPAHVLREFPATPKSAEVAYEARQAIHRRRYDEATALATTATSLVLTAWALGDPEMSPTIPCAPSALQGTPPGIQDDPVEQRKRSGVVPVQAESQAEAWERFKR